MSTESKIYPTKEKLGIIDRVKHRNLKASIFQEFGVSEGTVHGWMKEGDKPRLFVDQVGDKIGLDRKKARCSDVSEADECLYTWFVQKCDEGAPASGPLLQAQVVKFYK
jgi:hypothetical protein